MSDTPLTDAPSSSTSTDTPPDRLDINPKSRFHNAAVLTRGVGIRFKGVERKDVEEYCVSEGWIRVAYGKAMDRRGTPQGVYLRFSWRPDHGAHHTEGDISGNASGDAYGGRDL